jgi:hypothetical protein
MGNIYSKEVPVKVEKIRNWYSFNFNIKETTEEEILSLWESEHYGMEEDYGQPDDYFKEEHKYNYNQVSVPMGKWKYDEVVSAIIRDKYREDEMEAITNNLAAVNAMFFQTLVSEGIVGAIQYLRDSYKGDDTERFKEMQEWRALAKKEAREIFKV